MQENEFYIADVICSGFESNLCTPRRSSRKSQHYSPHSCGIERANGTNYPPASHRQIQRENSIGTLEKYTGHFDNEALFDFFLLILGTTDGDVKMLNITQINNATVSDLQIAPPPPRPQQPPSVFQASETTRNMHVCVVNNDIIVFCLFQPIRQAMLGLEFRTCVLVIIHN